METKEWTLFDYAEDVQEQKEVDLKLAISRLQIGDSIQYKRYKISKDKFYEVEFANEYHEFFYDEEALMRFLVAKGVM